MLIFGGEREEEKEILLIVFFSNYTGGRSYYLHACSQANTQAINYYCPIIVTLFIEIFFFFSDECLKLRIFTRRVLTLF